MSDMRNEVPQSAPARTEAPAGQEQGGDVNATGPEAVRAAFRRQARACAELGSPFNAALLDALADGLAPGDPVSDAVLGWPGRPVHDALALRVAGGLHALARDGRRPELSAIWAGGAGDPAAAARAAFAAEPAFLLPWLESPPQTNEPGRSAILLGGALIAAARLGMPFEFLEIGASAGLNLQFDRYAYDFGAGRRWPDAPSPDSSSPDAPRLTCPWEGAAEALPPLAAPLAILSRAGCDIAPIDAGDPAARARMLAYIWPDQTERLARVEAALAVTAAAGPRPEQADAGPWLSARLAAPQAPGTARLVAHTIVQQYMPRPVRAALEDALATAGARARADAPLLRLTLEPDGAGPGAAIRLHVWDGRDPAGTALFLGRGDYHGRWARWGAG